MGYNWIMWGYSLCINKTKLNNMQSLTRYEKTRFMALMQSISDAVYSWCSLLYILRMAKCIIWRHEYTSKLNVGHYTRLENYNYTHMKDAWLELLLGNLFVRNSYINVCYRRAKVMPWMHILGSFIIEGWTEIKSI